MGMVKFKAPALPLPHKDYDEGQQHQLNRALRIYFQQLDSKTSIEHDKFIGGIFSGYGQEVIQPYGSFFSTATQTAANTTTAYPITFSNTSLFNNVTLTNSSRLNVAYAGIYNLEFSLQLSNAGTAPIDMNVWLRKNGVDVASSNSIFGLSARKGPGDPYHTLGSLNLFVQLAANDYIELVWCTSDVNGSIQYLGAQSSPTRPETPSVIATLSFVSALPS